MLIWLTFTAFISFNNGLKWLDLFVLKNYSCSMSCFFRIPWSLGSSAQHVPTIITKITPSVYAIVCIWLDPPPFMCAHLLYIHPLPPNKFLFRFKFASLTISRLFSFLLVSEFKFYISLFLETPILLVRNCMHLDWSLPAPFVRTYYVDNPFSFKSTSPNNIRIIDVNVNKRVIEFSKAFEIHWMASPLKENLNFFP